MTETDTAADPYTEPESPAPDDVQPIEDVAAGEGIDAATVAAYQQAETDYGTGLLPARTWATALDHPRPDLGVMLEEGLSPSQPITWLMYHQLFRT